MIAVLIESTVLQDDLWFVLDEKKFKSDDGITCYYPDELDALREKTGDQLREIHRIKKAVGGRVRG